MNILFSVIIPTYNRASVIGKAIESILCQTYGNWELIVVDDGSIDNTMEVVMNYNNNKIRYFKKPNAGVSSARNYGVKVANGDYIVFLDSDDEAMRNMLETHLRFIVNYNVVLSIGWIYWMNGKVKKPKQGGKYFQDKLVMVNAGSYAVRKDLFNEINGFDEELTHSENWEMMIRLLYLINKTDLSIAYPQESVATYHKALDTATKVVRYKNRFYSYQRIFEKYKKLGWFSKHLTSKFAFTVASNAYNISLYREAVQWQLKALLFYPLLIKQWIKLFRYLIKNYTSV